MGNSVSLHHRKNKTVSCTLHNKMLFAVMAGRSIKYESILQGICSKAAHDPIWAVSVNPNQKGHSKIVNIAKLTFCEGTDCPAFPFFAWSLLPPSNWDMRRRCKTSISLRRRLQCSSSGGVFFFSSKYFFFQTSRAEMCMIII